MLTHACGHLRGVPRTPDHRFTVATEALSIVKEWNDQVTAAEDEDGFDRARYNPPRIEREFVTKSTENCPAKECLDPGGYCVNGDCLAVK